MTTSLVSIEKVRAYLDEQSIPYTSIKELSGGVANWTYLITKPDKSDLILKHTSAIVKGIPTLQAPSNRADYEAHALMVIPPLLKDSGSDVHLPTLLRYDAAAHVQHQLPGGTRTLKEAYTDPKVDITSVGERLGLWIAALHALTPPAELKDNLTARAIYGGSYRGCPGTLERWGIDPESARVALKKYEPLLKTESSNLCHGDFWTGNVLLPHGDESSPRLTIVDWEMYRLGNGATDIGQFAAEAWLLDHHRDNRRLLPAFLEAYRRAAGARITPDFVKRAAVHCGVHLAYWPGMVDWADTDGTKKILTYGAELLENAERGDAEWLKNSIFGPLMKS